MIAGNTAGLGGFNMVFAGLAAKASLQIVGGRLISTNKTRPMLR